MWAEYEVPPGPSPQESIVLITSAGEFTAPEYKFADAGAHCTFTDSSFRYDSLQALHPGLKTNILGRGQYAILAPGTYRVEITIKDNVATIVSPDGKRWRSEPSDTIADWSGPWATLQLYNQGDGRNRKALKVLRWGAELER